MLPPKIAGGASAQDQEAHEEQPQEASCLDCHCVLDSVRAGERHQGGPMPSLPLQVLRLMRASCHVQGADTDQYETLCPGPGRLPPSPPARARGVTPPPARGKEEQQFPSPLKCSTPRAIMSRILLHLRGIGLTFGGRPILENAELAVAEGERVALVGRNGSGKSTLTKLVQRLYVPQRGRVLIDGFDLADVDPASLRRQIGLVLQENILFNGTVRDNIALAQPSLSQAEVQSAARMAGAHAFITKLPQGYDTPIVERGTNLSGGQRQRIGLARAMYGMPELVVLDEPNANLDDEGEAALVRAVQGMKAKGKTVVLISHRPGIVGVADRLLILHQGTVQASGPRDGVLAALQQQREAAQVATPQS